MYGHQHRKIPRYDTADHTHGNAARPAKTRGAVFADFFFKVQHRQRAAHANATGNLAGRLRMRLALLAGQKPHEFVAVRLDRVGHLGKTGAPFFDAGFLPGGKCLARSGHGLIQFGLPAIGNLTDYLLGRGVDHVDPLAVIDEFATNQIIVLHGHPISPHIAPGRTSLCRYNLKPKLCPALPNIHRGAVVCIAYRCHAVEVLRGNRCAAEF